MSENGTLSRKQRRFVGALLNRPTVREAAAEADVSESTAWRYLGDSAVKRELATRQDALLAQVTSGLVGDMTEARQVLLDVMRANDAADGVRVRAALGVLDAGLKLFELLALADRVAAIESRLEASEHD